MVNMKKVKLEQGWDEMLRFFLGFSLGAVLATKPELLFELLENKVKYLMLLIKSI